MQFKIRIFNLIKFLLISLLLCFVSQSIQVDCFDENDYGVQWILLPIFTLLLHLTSGILALVVFIVIRIFKKSDLSNYDDIIFLISFYFFVLCFGWKESDLRIIIFPMISQGIVILFYRLKFIIKPL